VVLRSFNASIGMCSIAGPRTRATGTTPVVPEEVFYNHWLGIALRPTAFFAAVLTTVRNHGLVIECAQCVRFVASLDAGANRGVKAFNNELISSSPRSKGSISGCGKFAPMPCLLPLILVTAD
jgi:hypothetical protein